MFWMMAAVCSVERADEQELSEQYADTQYVSNQ